MPVLAEFAAAAQVGQREDAAVLEPGQEAPWLNAGVRLTLKPP